VEGELLGYRGGAMHDLGYELPRIPIPRTPVNKGKEKGRRCYTPALKEGLLARSLPQELVTLLIPPSVRLFL
jgi:hypothetical protein